MGHGSLLNGQLLSLKQVSFYFYITYSITKSYKEVGMRSFFQCYGFGSCLNYGISMVMSFFLDGR